jgi:hypothetical protein
LEHDQNLQRICKEFTSGSSSGSGQSWWEWIILQLFAVDWVIVWWIVGWFGKYHEKTRALQVNGQIPHHNWYLFNDLFSRKFQMNNFKLITNVRAVLSKLRMELSNL